MRRVTFLVAAVSPIEGPQGFATAAEVLQLSLSSSLDISSMAKLLASAELSSSCEELRSKVPCDADLANGLSDERSGSSPSGLSTLDSGQSSRPLNRGAGWCLHSKRRQMAINCGPPLFVQELYVSFWRLTDPPVNDNRSEWTGMQSALTRLMKHLPFLAAIMTGDKLD